MTQRPTLQQTLNARFHDAPDVHPACDGDLLHSMSARGSCRAFEPRAVPLALMQTLSAVALAAPTKSDLQQRDIVVLQDPDKRRRLADLVAGQEWVASAPMIAIFCGNNRRQRLLHEWRGVPFANDHLDAFFNAACDAAVALASFVSAAEATGLGCCPISAVRNRAAEVSDLLDLPQHVFPFAGLAVGYPLAAPAITKRLPLSVTCHVDGYREDGLREAVTAYDAKRTYGQQRFAESFGTAPDYGWSHDKARQYSAPERADFGEYVRAQGFVLD